MTAPSILIGGRYERLHRIASGGMATVYLGRTLGVGVGGFERPVAIKAMHPHISKDAEFVAMFLDEAKLAASIRHANVVATLDAIRDEMGLFLVMEYVEGLSLAELMTAARRLERPVAIQVALRILVDALAGLHAAHELTGPEGRLLNVIHRDVSPHNILVGLDGTARVADFGIARAEARRSATTHTGVVKGKTAYMSLEQLNAQPLDRRADVYAAGILLWELLAGRRLFDGDSEVSVALVAARGASEAPHEIDARVPRPISLACMKALARDPAQRWESAASFADALEDAATASNVVIARPKEVGRFVLELKSEQPPPSSTRHAGPAATPVPASVTASDAGPVSRTAGASSVSVKRVLPRPRRLIAIVMPSAAVGVAIGFVMFRLVTPVPEAPGGPTVEAASASPVSASPPPTARPPPPSAVSASATVAARPPAPLKKKEPARPKPGATAEPFRPEKL